MTQMEEVEKIIHYTFNSLSLGIVKIKHLLIGRVINS